MYFKSARLLRLVSNLVTDRGGKQELLLIFISRSNTFMRAQRSFLPRELVSKDLEIDLLRARPHPLTFLDVISSTIFYHYATWHSVILMFDNYPNISSQFLNLGSFTAHALHLIKRIAELYLQSKNDALIKLLANRNAFTNRCAR